MSDLQDLRQDLQALTAAIGELTLATRELVTERSGSPGAGLAAEERFASSVGGSKQWELLQDSTSIPGSPADFLQRPVVVKFELGPPETPDFCIQLASVIIQGFLRGLPRPCTRGLQGRFLGASVLDVQYTVLLDWPLARV